MKVRLSRWLLTICWFALLASASYAQTPAADGQDEMARGLQLLKTGNAKGAADLFKTITKKQKHIIVLRGLPDGLTEEAILAARKIRFRPATRNGRPISVSGMLEFSFNLY